MEHLERSFVRQCLGDLAEECGEGRSCVEEAVLARALLGPDAWLRDGDFNPDMRGLYSVDDLCVYVDDPDRGRRPVPLEEAREHILLDDATAPFLRLAGKIRPLGWVDGAEDAIPCDRDIMGTDSIERASAVDWYLIDWEACFDRRQGGSPQWVPVHVVTTCFELRVRSFHDRHQRWSEAGSLLQRRLCFVRDVIQEIEEEDGDDEDEAGVPPATEGESPAGLGHRKRAHAAEQGKAAIAASGAQAWAAISARLAATHGNEFVGDEANLFFALQEVFLHDGRALPEGAEVDADDMPLFGHPAVKAVRHALGWDEPQGHRDGVPGRGAPPELPSGAGASPPPLPTGRGRGRNRPPERGRPRGIRRGRGRGRVRGAPGRDTLPPARDGYRQVGNPPAHWLARTAQAFSTPLVSGVFAELEHFAELLGGAKRQRTASSEPAAALATGGPVWAVDHRGRTEDVPRFASVRLRRVAPGDGADKEFEVRKGDVVFLEGLATRRKAIDDGFERGPALDEGAPPLPLCLVIRVQGARPVGGGVTIVGRRLLRGFETFLGALAPPTEVYASRFVHTFAATAVVAPVGCAVAELPDARVPGPVVVLRKWFDDRGPPPRFIDFPRPLDEVSAGDVDCDGRVGAPPGSSIGGGGGGGGSGGGGCAVRPLDCVFIASRPELMARIAPWRLHRVEREERGHAEAEARDAADDTVFTELWRKRRLSGKVQQAKCARDDVQALPVGRVERVAGGTVSVLLFARPEQTGFGHDASLRHGCHELFATHERVTVPAADVVGKCCVVHVRRGQSASAARRLAVADMRDPIAFFFTRALLRDGPEPELAEAEAAHTAVRQFGEWAECEDGRAFLARLSRVEERVTAALAAAGSCPRPRSAPPLRSIDLFAGAGGLSEGLAQAGIASPLVSVEFERQAAAAYRRNFPDVPTLEMDAAELLKTVERCVAAGRRAVVAGVEMPLPGEVGLLCGGPPCQGFSSMNQFNKSLYSRLKNSLVATFLGFADLYRPRVVLMENVRAMASYASTSVIRACMRALLAMGYQCQFGVLQAGSYGVAQTRRRAILSSLRVNVGPWQLLPFSSASGAAPLRKVLAQDVLAGLPSLPCGGGAEEAAVAAPAAPTPAVAQLRGEADVRTRLALGSVVFDHQARDETPLNRARIELVPCRPGADWRNLPNAVVRFSSGACTVRLEYSFEDADTGRRRGVCACMEAAPAQRPRMKHASQENTIIPWCLPHTAARCNQWRALFGRVDPRSHFGTCVATPHALGKQGMNLHPRDHRILSCREMARAQGFPDAMRLAGDTIDKYRQAGNAVPPPLARAVGRQIARAIWPAEADVLGLPAPLAAAEAVGVAQQSP